MVSIPFILLINLYESNRNFIFFQIPSLLESRRFLQLFQTDNPHINDISAATTVLLTNPNLLNKSAKFLALIGIKFMWPFVHSPQFWPTSSAQPVKRDLILPAAVKFPSKISSLSGGLGSGPHCLRVCAFVNRIGYAVLIFTSTICHSVKHRRRRVSLALWVRLAKIVIE